MFVAVMTPINITFFFRIVKNEIMQGVDSPGFQGGVGQQGFAASPGMAMNNMNQGGNIDAKGFTNTQQKVRALRVLVPLAPSYLCSVFLRRRGDISLVMFLVRRSGVVNR